MKQICKDYYRFGKNSYITSSMRRAFSDDMYTRAHIARNLLVPASILEYLSHDKYQSIRTDLAYNNNCSIPVLEQLSEDPYWGVRYTVAQNPKTPAHILIKLSKDQDVDVSFEATTKLKSL